MLQRHPDVVGSPMRCRSGVRHDVGAECDVAAASPRRRDARVAWKATRGGPRTEIRDSRVARRATRERALPPPAGTVADAIPILVPALPARGLEPAPLATVLGLP